MSVRLQTGGRLLRRGKPIHFCFDGQRMRGFEGDTLASALLANGRVLVGRSFKYHRPRGLVGAGAEEPNALVTLGIGARREPNQRATTTMLFDGLQAWSQNNWPSLDFDLGAINSRLARFFPAGFYYKTFIHPRAAWKHVFEPVIRKAAGLGPAPTEPDPDSYEHFHVHVDVLVVGAGLAGLAAARHAADAGAQVLLIEQTAHVGGRILVDPVSIDGLSGPDWVAEQIAMLGRMPNVRVRTCTMGAGVYDHGYVLAYEQVGDHIPGDRGPRHRLWKIRASRVITATGAIERPLSFAGNDVPGVMLASAVRDYVTLWGVSPGARTVLVTNNDDAYQTALVLEDAGLGVSAILDARDDPAGQLVRQVRDRGIRVDTGRAVARVVGHRSVEAVEICRQDGTGEVLASIPCDCVAMSGGWSPVVHLWSHCGGKLLWREETAMFVPDPDRPPTGARGEAFVIPAGSAAGVMAPGDVLSSGICAGQASAVAAGVETADPPQPVVEAAEQGPLRPVWMMPERAGPVARAKAFLDFQNDVKVADVQLAAQEGFASVEHAKRYTTLGMATDQGKLSNINGLAILSDALGQPIPQTGTTTFRPPYTPISLGAIAGAARGALFKPLRKTPIDPWLDSHGAQWEQLADWRRPYAIRLAGETTAAAVHREVLNTRQNVGLLDASTLGKIVVKGPDAGRFLDLVYTNMMSTLAPGRCRYGLMCTDNGFLFDDGVVARLDEETFLCHTTSGGSDRVHAWLEEWLQTEWCDLQVYTANLTEQYAQIAVVGPRSRDLLESLGGMDVGRDALPFMGWAEGKLADIPARVFRISFSGELSFEVAVPASRGLEFWTACLEAGATFGVQPYGTEALHVMRAEKGFIMIGDETDGTVIPQDLRLGWAVSARKSDFIGKRAQMRSHMTDPDRKQLVGLHTLDPRSVLPDGAHAVDGAVRADGTARTIGHVTSSYLSPTLGRSIAMALIEGGSRRMGEILDFPVDRNVTIRARVVDPVFYDPEGARQNV